jgi:uncharacterized protein (TIGR02118 family)
MIKMLGLLTRKPHLTHEQFVDHWLNIHGPLALAVPGVRRYVQSHIVDTRGPTSQRPMSTSMASRNFGMMIWKRLSAPPRHPK